MNTAIVSTTDFKYILSVSMFLKASIDLEISSIAVSRLSHLHSFERSNSVREEISPAKIWQKLEISSKVFIVVR